MEQHRFRIVVRSMGCSDLAVQIFEKCVSGIPCRRFQSFFARFHFPRSNEKGNIVAAAKITDECFITVRFRSPQAVVKVGCGKVDVQFLFEKIQRKQQRYRIRTAGQGADDPVTGLHQLIFAVKG